MIRPIYKPFIWLGIFVMAVGLACGFGGGEPTPTPVPPPTDAPLPTSTPIPAPTLAPTLAPPPTATTAPTNPPPPPPTEAPQVQPTDEPQVSNDPPAYYIEEFEGDISNYSYFVFNGVDNGSDMLYTDSGQIVFDIQTQDTWVYMTYDPWIYGDVRIGLIAENRGKNSQRVSLICRMSEDGWFEFNVGGDGLYEILVYDSLNNRYFNLGNGGSTAIQLGRASNVYIAECIGNELSLSINGTIVKTLTIPNDYRFLTEGSVGFAVSSFNSLPVLIDIDWFGIEQP